MDKEYQGKITISRITGGSRKDMVCLKVKDSNSGITFLEVNISLENFGAAVTGEGYRPCMFSLGCTENIGKTRETRHLPVPYVSRQGADDEVAMRAALAPFEVDGWRGDIFDLGKPYKLCLANGGPEQYLVSFTRYV